MNSWLFELVLGTPIWIFWIDYQFFNVFGLEIETWIKQVGSQNGYKNKNDADKLKELFMPLVWKYEVDLVGHKYKKNGKRNNVSFWDHDLRTEPNKIYNLLLRLLKWFEIEIYHSWFKSSFCTGKQKMIKWKIWGK